MLRWSGLWRPVVRRARADWPFLLSIWLLIASAVTLLAAGALYADTVEVGGVRRAIANADPANRAVLVHTVGTRAEAPKFDATVGGILRSALQPAGGEVALAMRSSSLVPAGPASPTSGQHLTLLAAYDGIQGHAALVDGRWAQAGGQPVEATLSEGAAKSLGVGTGDRIGLADASNPRADPTIPVVTVQVVGVWRPAADDAFWLGDPLDLTGTQTNGNTAFHGPFVVAGDDLLGAAWLSQIDLQWRAIPDVAQLRVSMLHDIAGAIAGLPAQIQGSLPAGRYLTVATGLSTVLGGIDRSVLVSRSGVVLVTLQFAILAGYAVLFVGGMLADRRRAEVALLRSRGASSFEVGILAFGEALLLAAPAVIVAPWLALAVVNGVGHFGAVGDAGIISAGNVTDATFLVAVLAGVGCVAALTAPTLLNELDLARVRAALGRPLGRNLAQRLGIDLALVVLATVGLLQLRTYGAPLTQGTGNQLGVDPLLVAAPAIGLAAGAVLAIRLVPRLGEVAERLLDRLRGLVPVMSARQVSRRPLRYTRAALLLVLAAALGTFAAVYAATWSRSQADQAAYQSAADMRVAVPASGGLPSFAAGGAFRALPGVTAAMPVTRQAVDVGRVLHGGQLLAVSPDQVAAVTRLTDESSGQPLAPLLQQLRAGRPKTESIAISGDPKRLGLIVNSTLHSLDPAVFHLPDGWAGIHITAILQDGDGRLQRMPTVDAQFVGTSQRVAIPLGATINGTPAPMTYPISLFALEIVLNSPVIAAGNVAISSVDVSDSDSGNDWTALPGIDAQPDWFVSFSANTGDTNTYRKDQPASTIVVDEQNPIGTSIDPGVYRMWFPIAPGTALPVIAGAQFLAVTGAQVGDTIAATSKSSKLALHIAGSVETFPSLDSTQPFVIMDAGSLDLLRYQASGSVDTASEWWLSVADAGVPSVANTVAQKPYAATAVVQRVGLTRALESDPVALGTIGALALGSLAAIAFAVIGFLVSAAVSTRERLGEFALLRALGLSARQLVAWLSLENAFLLLVGLLVGSALGVLIALLVLPYTTLTQAGAAVVPKPVIVVPWEALAAVDGLGLLAMLATVLIASRQVHGAPIVDVLRARED